MTDIKFSVTMANGNQTVSITVWGDEAHILVQEGDKIIFNVRDVYARVAQDLTMRLKGE